MSVLTEGRVEDLIGKIYEAALSPASWRGLLHEIAGAVGAEGAVIFSYPQTPELGFYHSPGADDLVEWVVTQGAYLHNPRPERAMRFRASRKVVTEADLFTPWELKNLPFNAEMIGRLGYRWDAGGVFGEVNGTPLMLTVQRRQGQEGFGAEELRVLKALFPHFDRAAQVGARLTTAKAEGMLAAFDEMACAAVLLDHSGRVIRLNKRAETMVASLRGPKLTQGRLVCSEPESSVRLQRLIASVMMPGPSRTGPASAVLSQPGASGLAAYAMPIRGAAGDLLNAAKIILLLIDVAEQRSPSEAILLQAYGLTPAEIRLARALMEGTDLKSYATSRGISAQTARVQLRSIMAKTDTHRQAELVALLGRIAVVSGQVQSVSSSAVSP